MFMMDIHVHPPSGSLRLCDSAILPNRRRGRRGLKIRLACGIARLGERIAPAINTESLLHFFQTP
jgi:hypothetical protein